MTLRTRPSLGLWIDESEKGDLLAVGAVLIEWDAVPEVVRKLREIKTSFGLEPNAEIKWNLPSDHPTREALNTLKRTTRELLAEVVQFLSSSELNATFIVAVMFEERDVDHWKNLEWEKASVRDFYAEGLRYVLQRVAEEVVETTAVNCAVICDTPELGSKEFEKNSIKRGRKAIEKTYAEWYEQKGVGVGPGKQQHNGPLKEVGFQPSILIADATYHDMLQIADIVVGATRDWVSSIAKKKSNEWIFQQIRTLTSKFRARYGKPLFWGDGLVLWPWKKYLWQTLKESME